MNISEDLEAVGESLFYRLKNILLLSILKVMVCLEATFLPHDSKAFCLHFSQANSVCSGVVDTYKWKGTYKTFFSILFEGLELWMALIILLSL